MLGSGASMRINVAHGRIVHEWYIGSGASVNPWVAVQSVGSRPTLMWVPLLPCK